MSDTILNSFRSRDSFGGSGRRDLAGLSLDDILGSSDPKPPPSEPKKLVLQYSTSQITRTLLDVIREEEPDSGPYNNVDDNKAWRSFKDRLRLRGASLAWTPSLPVPASDEPIRSFENRNSVRKLTRSDSDMSDEEENKNEPKEHSGEEVVQVCNVSTRSCKPVMCRRTSVRFTSPDTVEPDYPVSGSDLRPSFSRRDSTRHSSSRTGSSRFLNRSESVAQRDDDLLNVEDRPFGRRMSSVHGEDRPMSAREAAASQEAVEAEAAAAAKEAEEAEPGFKPENEDHEKEAANEPAAIFSLMDLLEQTDKQMGWEGSRYMDEEDDDCEDEDDDDEEEDEYSGYESSCSVCMVKHREGPLVPCGHAYCKMCSRELYVSRSNCPVCNDFITEIIDVF